MPGGHAAAGTLFLLALITLLCQCRKEVMHKKEKPGSEAIVHEGGWPCTISPPHWDHQEGQPPLTEAGPCSGAVPKGQVACYSRLPVSAVDMPCKCSLSIYQFTMPYANCKVEVMHKREKPESEAM